MLENDEAIQLAQMTQRLEPFDLGYLASVVGCLQLLPVNAPNVLRLERAAAVLATLPNKNSKQRCSKSVIDQLINTAPVTTPQLLQYEDPFEEPWVQAIMGPSGEYLALPGNANRSVAMTEQLLGCMFFGNSPDEWRCSRRDS